MALTPTNDAGAPPLQRVDGAARIAFARDAGGRTRLRELHQRGAAKIRLPITHGGPPEAVLLNTAGGLTAGDRLRYDVELSAGAEAVAATQTAERAYKSLAEPPAAALTLRLTLGDRAKLAWMAQETILFDGGRLARRIFVDLSGESRLLMVEPLVIGRAAMGETVRTGAFSDQWRVQRDGALIYADAAQLRAPIADRLAAAPCWGEARAAASLLYFGPDAMDKLAALRRAVADAGPVVAGAASAWDGVASARLTAASGGALMRGLAATLERFRGAPVPRVWRC